MNEQYGLFDYQDRMKFLAAKGDPLVRLNEIIPWEKFRHILKKVIKRQEGGAGRPPYDVIIMFKIMILQNLYNLSDEQMEFQIADRLSFMRFVGLDFKNRIPDENTIRLFREKLKDQKLIRKLFDKFDSYLQNGGFVSRKGTIVDASIIEVPRQRNTKKENKQIKNGEKPEHWKNKNMMAQKDTDARWLTQSGVQYFGYKNHTSVDSKSKLVLDYDVSPACDHDSKSGLNLMKRVRKKIPVYADSAYQTPEIHEVLDKRKCQTRISKKGYRNKSLTSADIKRNTSLARIRGRIEHVFGDMKHFGGDLCRYIGIERTEFKIGLTNLVYNMRRYSFLSRQVV